MATKKDNQKSASKKSKSTAKTSSKKSSSEGVVGKTTEVAGEILGGVKDAAVSTVKAASRAVGSLTGSSKKSHSTKSAKAAKGKEANKSSKSASKSKKR